MLASCQLHAFSTDELTDLLVSAGVHVPSSVATTAAPTAHHVQGGTKGKRQPATGPLELAVDGSVDNATWLQWLPTEALAMRAALSDFLALYGADLDPLVLCRSPV